MFCKLSFSNIKKGFRDYSIYFITLVLGVSIFYIFNSLDSQLAMSKMSEISKASQNNIVKTVVNFLSYVSVFVSIVLGFLVIYASRFFIKKRKKEFGIYMTLGMSKSKISLILLLETLIIGILSLGVGLVLGVVLSQVTSVFIANMLVADMSKYVFVFSKAATVKTIFCFGIIYIVVMLFNTIVVSKNKLINLITEIRKQEKIKIKNPIISTFLFILSIIMLVGSYYMLKKYIDSSDALYHITILLFIGVGTVLFFYSLATMMLTMLSKCHKLYYNRLNTFVYKQLSSKINTMVATISLICLMLFVTLCILPLAFQYNNNIVGDIKKYSPADFQISESSYVDRKKEDVDGERENVDINTLEKNMKEYIDSHEIIKNNTKDITLYSIYKDESLTYEVTLGKYKNEVVEENQNVYRLDEIVEIMGESDYNNIANLFKFDKVQLNNDEYAIVANANSYVDIYKKVVDDNTNIKVFNKNLKPHKKVIEGFRSLDTHNLNNGIFVVKDSVLVEKNKSIINIAGNYSTNDDGIKDKIEKLLFYKEGNDRKIKNVNDWFTRTKMHLISNEYTQIMQIMFPVIYVGIVFLISSAAIIALKQLSDSIDDREKYKLLRQIGADEKDINKSLMKQTFIFFTLPLSLALVHAIVVMKILISGIGEYKDSAYTYLIKGLSFFVVIYGIYFIITYICSKNIIKRRMY